ncbi:MAG: hypothetical protein DRP66_03590 [Planctomycetota bacterium]|nr:MAG: hypothetical protein DRP66_03590 [Planctomycetota bacterium]
MSKLKRMKKKQALRKRASIRITALRRAQKDMFGRQSLFDKMVNNHQDILQNIEFVIISEYRHDSRLDDGIVAETLKAIILNTEPQDKSVDRLKQMLESARRLRDDVSDNLWRDGLRVVLRSVHNHSDFKPGSTHYLDFVGGFIV